LKNERGKPLLPTFGEAGRLLKRKIALTGFLFRLLLFLIFNPFFLIGTRFYPVLWTHCKKFAIKLVKIIFPFDISGQPVNPSLQSPIFIINHPTLNDPICTILYAIMQYPEREIIVPVNLPWYESIYRYRDKLLKIGIRIVPILTPETIKRLGSSEYAGEVQQGLVAGYTAELAATLQSGGMAVVAQQATRQRHLFANITQAESGEGILATVSLILIGLKRAKIMAQVDFVPIGVIPHVPHAKPRINLFCKYTLNIGKAIPAEELSKIKNESKRPADLFMLHKLKMLLPGEYHYAQK
jgi:hypothetical protein